ncbi:MAG: alanine dehydrogenase [Bacteroidetes bacterium]|nr:alanine dehydrogenase [Bacteroidota bacterium]
MRSSEDLLRTLAKSAFLPQEETLELSRRESSLFIGMPKESAIQENRVPLVPDSVAVLVSNGHRVIVETKAGEGANFQDRDYSEAGAEIAYNKEEVYKADILLKVSPPSLEEIKLLNPTSKQILFSALQLPVQPRNFMQQLMSKKVTAIAFDYIKDAEGIYPIVRAMSEIAGTSSILIAGELLSNMRGGYGQMLGGISGVKPTEVVIIGAGTVGEFATRAALGLGASVRVFDDNIYKLRRLQNHVGQRLNTSVLQPKVLRKALKNADVVIGALRPVEGKTPCVVPEDMVSDMRQGSVIVDVSIDCGGCFETSEVTSHESPTYKKHGIIHYCVPNIAARVSRTASYALSNVFTPLILDIGQNGGIEKMVKKNTGLRHGVYMYRGTITNKILGEAFCLPYKDIDLLMAAF